MKRSLFLIPVLAFTSAFAVAATVHVSAPPLVSGSIFDVNVSATNVFANFPDEAITGFGFHVVVGSPIFTFTGVTVNGTYFDDFSGCCLGTEVVGLPNFGFPAGIGPTDFTEPLLLATLHFSVNGPGSTAVGISANNADPNQGLSFLTGSENFADSQLVTAVASAPEPGTVGIAGLGLIGLWFLRGVRAR